MTVESFRDLRVYQRAYSVSLEIHKASLMFPQLEQYSGLAKQIREASKSICANLAEGFGKQNYSRKEYTRFIAIAIGSSDEMKTWLDYAKDLGYISKSQHQAWQEEYTEISKMLVKLYAHFIRIGTDS